MPFSTKKKQTKTKQKTCHELSITCILCIVMI